MTSAERATGSSPSPTASRWCFRQFVDTLGRSGITKVPTVGQQFDPGLHEAIQQVETDETPPERWWPRSSRYLQGERLIRAAMVVVAKPKAGSAPADGDSGAGGTKETEA